MNNVIQSMTPCSLLGLLLLRIQYLTAQDTCQLFPALGWVVTKFSPSVVSSFLNKTINGNNRCEDVPEQHFCNILSRKHLSQGQVLHVKEVYAHLDIVEKSNIHVDNESRDCNAVNKITISRPLS